MSESSTSIWPGPFEPESRAESTVMQETSDEAGAASNDARADAGAAVLQSSVDGDLDLRVVEIVPHPRDAVPRAVGPGRRERAYLERVAALQSDLALHSALCSELELRTKKIAGELELASLLERGSERRLTRTERELARSRAEAELAEQRENRLILALGALQNENQRLSEKLMRLQSSARPALGPRRASGNETETRPRRGWRAFMRRWIGD